MRNMLVAVDGSEYSLAAVKAAAKLAAERGIKKVTLLFGLYFLYVSVKFITGYFGIRIW